MSHAPIHILDFPLRERYTAWSQKATEDHLQRWHYPHRDVATEKSCSDSPHWFSLQFCGGLVTGLRSI
jgi:hypothetical protein